MEQLKEQLLSVAKEYARQFAEIIGSDFEHFVGDDPTDVLCFGDTLFFSLTEVKTVVDNIDKYARRYGSREAVGEEVRDWTDWWLYPDGLHLADDEDIREMVARRVTHQLRPAISLKAWLDGCPREERKAWSGPDADWLRLTHDKATLERLIKDYGPDQTLRDVLKDTIEVLDYETEMKARRDFEDWQRIMKGKAGQAFREAVREETRSGETPEQQAASRNDEKAT